MKTLSDKVVLLTGATDGLGKLLAQRIAVKNARLVLHGRDFEKGKRLVNDLVSRTGNERINYYNADYASLKEVMNMSEKILTDHDRIDLLINNVGVGGGPDDTERIESLDGFELRFAVNYLAHVILTENLLPLMVPNESEIINVASAGQDPINFNDIMLRKKFHGFHAYKQSKTAFIMYTYDLAERLKDRDIKVNAIHPASMMNTKMVLDAVGYSLTTVGQGADAVENLFFTDVSGYYFNGKDKAEAIAQTKNPIARAKLRDYTNSIIHQYLLHPVRIDEPQK